MRSISLLLLAVAMFVSAPTSHAEAWTPIAYADGLVWVDVKVDGEKEPLHFLLDSGAGATVIHTATARRLGLHVGSEERVQGVSGSVAAYRITNFSAHVGAVPLPRRVLALDLASVSQSCHQRIDGLLGLDFLRHGALELDFAHLQMRFVSPGEISRQGAVALPLSRRNDAVGTLVSVQHGRPEWMRIDTGCTTALRWVHDGGVAQTPRAGTTVGLATGGGQYVNTDVQLGDLHLSNVRTGLHRRAIFPGEAGLVGNGILARFKVTLDVPGKQLLLHPRS